MNRGIDKKLFFHIISLSIPLFLMGCMPNHRDTASLKESLKSRLNINNISEEDLFIRALIRMELFDHLGAIKDFNKLQAMNPNSDKYFSYSAISNNKYGDYRGAINAYNKAILTSKDKEDKELYYFERGNLYYKIGENNKAKQDYDNAIKISNKEMSSFFNRSNIHYLKGNTRAAIKDLDKAIELNLKSSKSYNNRGTYKFIEGSIIEALKDFNLAIKYNKDNAVSYYNRSVANHKLKRKRSACSDLLKSIKLGYEITEEGYKIICE